MSYYKTQLVNFLKTLTVKADTVYDIGGAQSNVKDRVALWDVKNYKVLDLPDFDIQDEEIETTHSQEADVIFCLEVFEYLIQPAQAMLNIAAMLNDDGKAYVTFAFAYPHHQELESDSLRYTEPGIKRLAQLVDLNITSTWYRIDKSGLLRAFYAADGMHPAKDYNHHEVTGFIMEFKK